ncbi:MAG TPA: hypothetical protein ENH12_04775 [Proteobacteria bacterium]|nr:hypothetical protein [Pseudomonadota bacterium]
MLISGIAVLLIGAAPLILFNILNSGKTFLKILDQDPRTQKSLINGLENLSTTFIVFIETLNGFWLEKRLWLGHFTVPLFFPYLFAFSLLVITCLIITSRRANKKDLSAAEFVLILFLGILFFAMITPQTWGAHHMLMTYPFPHILCGIVLVLIFSPPLFQKIKIRILACAALLLFSLTVYTDCRLTLLLHQTFAVDRSGWWAWSSRINEVADYLVTQQNKTTLCLDWGLYRNLAVLTGGRARMEDKWQALNDLPIPESFKEYFSDPNYLYLLHPENISLFPENSRIFHDALLKYGYKARRVKSFSEQGERDLYILYEVKPSLN